MDIVLKISFSFLLFPVSSNLSHFSEIPSSLLFFIHSIWQLKISNYNFWFIKSCLLHIWDCLIKCLYVHDGSIILYLLLSILTSMLYFTWILFCWIFRLLPQLSFNFSLLPGVFISALIFLCLSVLNVYFMYNIFPLFQHGQSVF